MNLRANLQKIVSVCADVDNVSIKSFLQLDENEIQKILTQFFDQLIQQENKTLKEQVLQKHYKELLEQKCWNSLIVFYIMQNHTMNESIGRYDKFVDKNNPFVYQMF